MSCKYIVYWLLLFSILITQTWEWVIVHVHTSFIHRIPMKSRFMSHNKNTKRDRWDHKQFLKIFDWQHKNVTSWVTNFKLDFSPSPWHNVRAGFPRQYYRFKIFFKKGGRGGEAGANPMQNNCYKSVKVCKGLWRVELVRFCRLYLAKFLHIYAFVCRYLS